MQDFMKYRDRVVNSKSTTIYAAPYGISEPVPKIVRKLTLIIAFYLAAPLFVVPLIGISLSAPLIYLLCFEVYRQYGGLKVRSAFFLFLILGLLWISAFISLSVHIFSDDYGLDLESAQILIVRYAYWFITGLLACRVLMKSDLGESIVKVFGWGCFFVALICLAQYLFVGELMILDLPGINLLTQNSYGWQFSAFFPFILHITLFHRTKWRIVRVCALAVVIITIALNASRSSWATTAVCVCCYLGYFTFVQRFRILHKIILGIMVIAVAAIAIFSIIPPEKKEKMFNRPITQEEIEYDKSWQIRKLLVQKGINLFKENPITGVGPGQFRYASTYLDIPQILSYASQHYFDRKSSHNSYIMLLAEGGLLFVIPFGLLLIWLALSGFKSVILLVKHGELWSLPFYISFISFSIHYWTLSGITSTAPWFLYGILAAIIYRARIIRKMDRLHPQTTGQRGFYNNASRVSLSHPR